MIHPDCWYFNVVETHAASDLVLLSYSWVQLHLDMMRGTIHLFDNHSTYKSHWIKNVRYIYILNIIKKEYQSYLQR